MSPRWSILLGISLLAVPLAAQAETLRITRGGTYHGAWASPAADVPAVTIETTEPVIIEHSNFTGPGPMIRLGVAEADVTVRDCTAVGQRPREAGKFPGRFLSGERFARVIIEHCQIEGTSGIYLLNARPGGHLQVSNNRFRNIDGRLSDGKGGLNGEFYRVQFLQLDKVRGLAEATIAWNEVLNEPGKSRVEDVISIYESAGTAEAPITLRDNLIDGAYPADPAREGFSGGGIMAADGPGGGHVLIERNTVLNTSNYGIATSAGRDITIRDNTVISSNHLSDGTFVSSANVGIYIWNSAKDPAWGDITVTGNVLGWLRRDESGQIIRNDLWRADTSPARVEKNFHMTGQITPATEQDARTRWHERQRQTKQPIGPRP